MISDAMCWFHQNSLRIIDTRTGFSNMTIFARVRRADTPTSRPIITEEDLLQTLQSPKTARGPHGFNADTEKPLYRGSCHCGFLAYIVRLDLTYPHPLTGEVLTRCDCHSCRKYGLLTAVPYPASSFELVAPAAGREVMRDHGNNSKVHRWLCPQCGVQIFTEGTYVLEALGVEVTYLRINAATLDGRADGGWMIDLQDVEVRHYFGMDPVCREQSPVLRAKPDPWSDGGWV